MAEKDEFQLTITSEKGVIYYGECVVLFLPTSKGEVAIMKHHTPMIMKLSAGDVRMRSSPSSSTSTVATLTTGVVYVAQDKVSVLVDL